MKGFVTDPKKTTAFERMQLSWTGGLFYEAILLACAGGCDAPLVGHNVALRWSAMVKIAKRDEHEAARVVDTAARRLRGEDAHGGRSYRPQGGQGQWLRLNFPTHGEVARAKALGMPK